MILIMTICICSCGAPSDDISNADSSLEQEENTNIPNEDTDIPNENINTPNDSSPEPQEESKPSPHTHSYSSSVIQDASCTQDGSIQYICSCGDSYTEYIPALGHSFSQGICSRCGVDAVNLCSVSSIYCPDRLTYHYINPAGIEIESHPIKNLSVTDVYFAHQGDDIILHLTLNGTVSSNVADGDGFGYVTLGGDRSGQITIPASSTKSYSHEFFFTNITPGSYSISIDDFYHYS